MSGLLLQILSGAKLQRSTILRILRIFAVCSVDHSFITLLDPGPHSLWALNIAQSCIGMKSEYYIFVEIFSKKVLFKNEYNAASVVQQMLE